MAFKFFDEIIVISLERRLDRRLLMVEQMEKSGLDFRFFNAVDDENGVRGLVGSMKILLKQCLDKHYQNVLILEDDAKFLVEDAKGFFDQVIPQIPDKYNCFYLGLNLLSRPLRISENVLKVNDCYSTHAICYSKEGMEWVLQFLETSPLMPYDQFLRQWLIPMGMSYCSYPMMMTQRDSYSDIEKGNPRWGELMAMTFAMMTKYL